MLGRTDELYEKLAELELYILHLEKVIIGIRLCVSIESKIGQYIDTAMNSGSTTPPDDLINIKQGE